MAVYVEEVSRTFGEYLLIPGLTTKQCVPSNVSLRTPLVKHAAGTQAAIELNIPFVSAIMQSVSGPELAIELARNGGLSFIFGSQPIASQAEMVRKVKKFKAGFVTSDSNLTPEHTLDDVLRLLRQTGHSTIGITDDGTPNGHLLGLVTSRDYRLSRDPLDKKIKDFMTPFDKLIVGEVGLTLSEANQIIWDHKLNTLPIIDKDGRLAYFVFRKDYDSHKENPNEVSSPDKKLLVGAGINTRDYQERVPALVEAGVDVLCIDSSDGYSEWQYETLQWIKQQYGDKVLVGAGNVVDKEGFLYLAEAGADEVLPHQDGPLYQHPVGGQQGQLLLLAHLRQLVLQAQSLVLEAAGVEELLQGHSALLPPAPQLLRRRIFQLNIPGLVRDVPLVQKGFRLLAGGALGVPQKQHDALSFF